MVSSIEEQSFIVGDVMKSIDEIYSSAGDYDNPKTDNKNSSKNKENSEKSKPDHILVFVDEINRFLPKLYSAGRMNAVAEQIMKTLIGGRSRGTILFCRAAIQKCNRFAVTRKYRATYNSQTRVTGAIY